MTSFSLGKFRRFHFVGIGGMGMSAVAEILKGRGFEVSGSDMTESPNLDNLRRSGIRISIGHQAKNLAQAQAVVVSSAIPANNPELAAARQQGLAVVHRSEVLAALMQNKTGITVCGTHGKSTTCAMLSTVLIESGADPTIILGARLPGLDGKNARLGGGDLVVAEADESDRSFLRFWPVHTIVTNIDNDHLDHYRDFRDLQQAFLEHMNRIPSNGVVAACLDDYGLSPLLKNVHTRLLTYGLKGEVDFSACKLGGNGFRLGYECLRRGQPLGRIELRVPGRHNLLNSLAAVALSLELEIPFQQVQRGLEAFRGVERRMQWKGERSGVWVLDDYGHHPTEIRAALAACRSFGRRVVVVYQPHRYSRTRMVASETERCFEDADQLFLMDIFAAGEEPIEGVDSGCLSEAIGRHREVTYVPDGTGLVRVLRKATARGDLLLTLGSGDVWKVGEEFLG